MREILFHGKRIDNGEWVEGDLIQLHDGRRFIVDNRFGACLDAEGNFINTEAPFVCEVDPATVGQFTLTNKNGKKVFEGDIVKRYDSARAYQVKWNPTFPAFWCFRSSDYKFLLTEDFEVIGSIHDNPELLEEAKCD